MLSVCLRFFCDFVSGLFAVGCFVVCFGLEVWWPLLVAAGWIVTVVGGTFHCSVLEVL